MTDREMWESICLHTRDLEKADDLGRSPQCGLLITNRFDWNCRGLGNKVAEENNTPGLRMRKMTRSYELNTVKGRIERDQEVVLEVGGWQKQKEAMTI